MSEDMGVRAFGVWDAPMTDGAEWIDVPLGMFCMYCRRAFVEGDNGCIMVTGYAQHRECGMRGVMGGIGHLVNHARYCRGVGPDAGLNYRQSAWLVWRHLVDKIPVTEEELDALVELERQAEK